MIHSSKELKILIKIFGRLKNLPYICFIKFKHLFIHLKIKAMKTSNVADLLFDVEKVQYSDSKSLSDCSFDIFAYPNGEKTRIQTCSDRYELVPNTEIFPTIRQTLIGSSFSNFTESYEMNNYSLFSAKYILEDMAIQIKGANDIIKPTIIVHHSYNGMRKYAIKFGFFRLVCSNGLTVPVKEMEFLNLQIGGKHTISIRHSIELLMNRLTYVVNNLPDLTAGFNMLANEVVTDWSARVIEVMAQAGIKKGQEDVLATIRKESADLGSPVNNWLIYNGINQYVYNDQKNVKMDEVRESIDRKVLSLLSA